MIQVNIDTKEGLIVLYGDNGILDHVIDYNTGKKMMVEYTQEGSGYELTKNNGYVEMSMCNAVYVRIIDLDIFVPKFLYIRNETKI
jgi:hypothetical protein